LIKKSETTTIAIFTKLFAIRIVASNVLGFSFKAIILLLDLVSSASRLAISLGESEKNAISLPDMNAEERINNIKKNKEIKTPLASITKNA